MPLLRDRDRTMVATMQSPSRPEFAARDTAPQMLDALEVDPGRALGIALALRSEECCELTQTRLASYPWVGRAPSVGYIQRVRGINWFATLLVARWIGYG